MIVSLHSVPVSVISVVLKALFTVISGRAKAGKQFKAKVESPKWFMWILKTTCPVSITGNALCSTQLSLLICSFCQYGAF